MLQGASKIKRHETDFGALFGRIVYYIEYYDFTMLRNIYNRFGKARSGYPRTNYRTCFMHRRIYLLRIYRNISVNTGQKEAVFAAFSERNR